QLASLAATATGDGVSLTWRTLSEVNSYGFEVQRRSSASGAQWSDAGFVPGGGTTTAERTYAFTDPAGTVSSAYRLKQIDLDGSVQYSSAVTATVAPAEDAAHPSAFFLSRNYPNPFNPSTQITYGLPSPGVVSLVVFDILGREVATLASGYRQAGTYTARWDATGSASGLYIARLRITGGSGEAYTSSTRLLLAK
ncbi:MAG TPA: T9SS type A sorting domain-containing protein, partial [Bacteroidota bacterium]|nr:T9SS type A sorting domain-containing protein [Bacteroidota bacterium]